MAITKVKGIDISKWQGEVDFKKVSNDGIDFLLLRSSFRHTVDSKFFDYVKGSNEYGIPVIGVYHFSYALSVAQATSEAKFCIEQVEAAGLDKDTIIFFDFEYDTVKKAKESGVTLKKADCVAHAKAFCEYVEKQGYKAGIYCNLDYYKNWYTKDILDKYYLWLADYSGDPDYDCAVQQYTSSGKVDGISGNVDLDYLYLNIDEDGQNSSNSSMGDEKAFSRSVVIDIAKKWIGLKESDGSFKEIIDIYNTYTPHPRGFKMNYKTAWCACFCSAVAIKAGYTDIIPIEVSCGEMINLAKKMRIWVEDDSYIPSPGDLILYDWDDSGKGNNTGWPDHIGIVELVSDGNIRVIEGNYSNSVKRRTVLVNGRYIRGFICPKYTDSSISIEPDNSGKSVEEVAQEVINGLWGNGEERKKRLHEFGYDYDVVQAKVNEILNGEAYMTDNPDQSLNQPTEKTVIAEGKPSKFNKNLAGVYKTTGNLYIRNGSGTNKKAMAVIPNGVEVKCQGYYDLVGNTKWLYINANIDGVCYIGFSSTRYLKKK